MSDSATASSSDAPPPPPPGFEDVAPGTHGSGDTEDVAALAKAVEASKVTPEGEDIDAPDTTLGAGPLVEEATEIKTVLAADATPYTSAKSFEDLNLSPELLKGLYKEMGFTKPSRVQAQSLPMILLPPYRHLIAQAHNGSGKTTCFVLGMLSRVDAAVAKPQALCMCPTRELVVQNAQVLQKMGTHTRITCATTAAASASSSSHRSAASSRMPPIVDQVVIGTPGSIINWIAKRILPLRDLRIVVFDEADAMWEDSFATECLKILRSASDAGAKPQLLLFSATFSEHVKTLATKLVGPSANTIIVPREQLSLDVIKQYRVDLPNRQAKEKMLRDIFPLADKLGQTIIFVRTRADAHRLHDTLAKEGHKCTSIAGDMRPEDRDAVITEFRNGNTKILIATDVLARGFDHATVTLVINYDPPVEQRGHNQPAFETYMHRIGRSGRFGRKGAAFNFIVTPEDRSVVNAIAAHFAREIPAVPYDQEEAIERVLQEAGLCSA